MNRLTPFVALFLACAPAGLIACSGSTPANGPQDAGADGPASNCATGDRCLADASSGDAAGDGGSEMDSTVATDSGASADTGGASDGGADSASSGDASSGNDAALDSSAADSGAADAAEGDAALPPTPGIVACGQTTCPVPSSECCIDSIGDGTCVDAGTACGENTATVQCNETADCLSNQVCCVTATADGGIQVFAACQAGPCATAQACRTNAECGGTTACVVQNCGNSTFELCGQPLILGTMCTLE